MHRCGRIYYQLVITLGPNSVEKSWINKDELDSAGIICIDAFIAKNQSDFTEEKNGCSDSGDAEYTMFTFLSQNDVDEAMELLRKFNFLTVSRFGPIIVQTETKNKLIWATTNASIIDEPIFRPDCFTASNLIIFS